MTPCKPVPGYEPHDPEAYAVFRAIWHGEDVPAWKGRPPPERGIGARGPSPHAMREGRE